MKKKPLTYIALILIFCLFLQGCAALPYKYNLKELFASYLPMIDDNPVILIPGIIGSRLVNTDTGKTLWGTVKVSQILSDSARHGIALPIDKLPINENRDSVVSQGIIDKYELPIGIVQFKVYRELLDMFEEVGYKLGDIKNPKPDDSLFIFDYDWRRDNVENAMILAERIEDLKKARGKPNEKYNLVCHSMGGLIGRYYLRYGNRDVLNQYPNFKANYAGGRNIKRLILIAVPNLGSLPLFKFLHKGLNLTIVKYPPYVLSTMPSAYQLMPPRRVASFVDGDGNKMDVDLYDVENWKKYRWSIYSPKMVTYMRQRYIKKYRDTWEEEYRRFEVKRDEFMKAVLQRADRFQESLKNRLKQRAPCEIILFGGDTEWTIDKAILIKSNGKWGTHFWDPRLSKKIQKPGDSMVTRESHLGFPTAGVTRKGLLNSPIDISYALFVTQRHENIHKDNAFQDNLIHILLEN